MITKVHVHNVITGQEIDFPMFSPVEYAIRSIEGLTPTKTILSEYSAASLDGTDVTSVRVDKRQITLTIGFNKNDITSLRKRLYGVLGTASELKLSFTKAGGTVYSIWGIVSSHESNVFSDDPLSQIVIDCPFPYFMESEPQTTEFEFFDTQVRNNVPVHYHGDVPTGVFMSWSHEIGNNRSEAQRINIDIRHPASGSTISNSIGNLLLDQDTIRRAYSSLEYSKDYFPRGLRLSKGVYQVYTNSLTPYTNHRGVALLGNLNQWYQLKPGPNYFDMQLRELRYDLSMGYHGTLVMINPVLFSGI